MCNPRFAYTTVGAATEGRPYKVAVSIIIPAYNSSDCLGETLASVFMQTFSDYEVIVINDGSPDTEQLEKVLEPYQDRVVCLKQENLGAAAARNTGLRIARGELIAFLDADDRWLPTYLEEQLKYLKETGADIVYADALMMGDAQLTGRTYMELAPSRCEVTPESLLSVDVGVITSGVVAPRTLIEQVGLFDESIRRGHDFDLWLRLAQAKAKFACHKKVLVHYNAAPVGLSGDTVSQLERRLELLRKIQARGGLTITEDAALKGNLETCTARLAVENGRRKLLKKDFSGALESFNKARKLSHSWKLVLVCFGLRLAPELFWYLYRGRSGALS